MDRIIERLATITEHLVSFPTVAANPDAIHQCVDWARAHVLTRAPRLRARQFVANDKPSLLFTCGDIPPRVLLTGHLDVVSADASMFKATPQGETRLAGRGVADMKGPVAALMDIIENDALPGLGLVLTTDEEIGGANGTAYVLRQLDWQPEIVFLPDGGANMRLITAQKGVLRLRLTAPGKAAHGSRPWLGDNAIEKLIRGYQALLRAYPIPADEDDWRISINLSQIEGGNAPNSVPDEAHATLDVRYPANGPDAGELLLQDMRRRLSRYDITATAPAPTPAFALDADAPGVQLFQNLAHQLIGHELPLAREAGASDAHYYAAANIPVIICQPECHGWHGPEEWVDLASLATFRKLVATFAKAYLAREPTTKLKEAKKPAVVPVLTK
jgi:succinyl-diaminopimelate desuccinylase